jgi:DNA-binding NtrC family response regulator
MAALKVLAVDDDEHGLFALQTLLTDNGYEVITAQSGKETLQQVALHEPDVILLDVQMPAPDGYQVTKLLKADERYRFIPVILLTGKDDLDDIVYGLDQGADDYIKKPYHPKELLARLHAAARSRAVYSELQSAIDEAAHLRREVAATNSYENIIGQSEGMKAVFRVMDKIRGSVASVLITGESGTGKELIAKALHYSSARKNKPFVASNVSALQDTLLESELFGHVKGAFTGAVKDKIGLFEAANGGTLFLDELGEMSPSMQAKLLRVLQDGTFLAVGDVKPRKVDVRVIGATHRNLQEMIASGGFREDLFYRLNVIQIELPSLRDRRDDIPLLVDFFIKQQCSKHGYQVKSVSAQAMNALVNYRWPGNIRQLQNEIERMLLMSEESSVIDVSHLSSNITGLSVGKDSRNHSSHDNSEQGMLRLPLVGSLKAAIESVEKAMLADALKRHKGNKSEVARELELSRSSVISKVQTFGLENKE